MTTPEPLYRLIPLTQGQWTIVDAADYDWLMQWKWYAQWSPNAQSFYAERHTPFFEGKRQTIKMHRFILGLESGDKRQADHRDHDTLNNRRWNLRVASHAENVRNRRVQKSNKLGCLGVGTSYNRYIVRIMFNGEPIGLGSFPKTSEGLIAASERYQFAADLYFGEFACLDK